MEAAKEKEGGETQEEERRQQHEAREERRCCSIRTGSQQVGSAGRLMQASRLAKRLGGETVCVCWGGERELSACVSGIEVSILSEMRHPSAEIGWVPGGDLSCFSHP